jgi:hypothetical protein
MNPKTIRIENSVKYLVTKGCSKSSKDYVKIERDGMTDFCNLVRYQLKCENITLMDAADFVIYSTKFN